MRPEGRGEFDCGLQEYNDWLLEDAPYFLENNFARVKLLIHKKSADVVGYMALSADAFPLSQGEKDSYGCRFGSMPALKVGKLASAVEYRGQGVPYLLLTLALGIADAVNEAGGACRFLTVDADETANKGVSQVYLKFGFKNSQKVAGRQNPNMRLDLFEQNVLPAPE